MILHGVLFVFLFGVLDVGICAPAENEKIDPLDLNYFCFYLKENEKSSASPIVLLHAVLSYSADYNNIYETLAVDTGRKVCTVDIRNHGESPWSDRSDVEAMTVDLENFLKERNYAKVNLVGHNLGGKIAVHYALKHPEQVDSLVVEDMRPNGATENAVIFVKSVAKFLEEALKEVPENSSEDEVKDSITQFLTNKLNEIGEPAPSNLRDLVAVRFDDGKWQYKMNFDVLKKSIDDHEDSLTPSSGLYNGPALFIYGAKSPFDVGGDESNIRKLFPQAKLVPVAGASYVVHGLHREYIDEVVKFLNNI